MELSDEQEAALGKIMAWAKDSGEGLAYFTTFALAGYAGTGKTTLMASVINAFREEGLGVHCCAPTGKAAAVLQRKLGQSCGVTTIHGFIYSPVQVSEGDLDAAQRHLEEMLSGPAPSRDPNQSEMLSEAPGRPVAVEWPPEAIDQARERVGHLKRLLDADMCDFEFDDRNSGTQIVIVDEASMVNEEMERDLRKVAGKILFVGDPGQLDPVNGRSFFERNKPDAMLEQIHRQAEDSGILQFATAIRNDWYDERDTYSDVTFIEGEPSIELCLEADVIITGRNETRRNLNRLIRHHRGFQGTYPRKGERVMCLKNNRRELLVNGIGGITTTNSQFSGGNPSVWMEYEGVNRHVHMDRFNFDIYESEDPSNTRRLKKQAGAQFDFGYAITGHKSQGSEWPTVMVWDDKMREHDTEARRKWMYTVATRAQMKLIWVNA